MSHGTIQQKNSYTTLLITIAFECKLYVFFLNFVDDLKTLPKNTKIRPFVHAKNLFPVDPVF